MLYLLLAIASSATIAVVMRLSSRVVRGNISMLAVNYLTCLSLAALYARAQLFSTPLPDLGLTVGLGAVNGVLYLAGFVLLQYNTRKNGVVLSSVFMKLGLLVPVVMSVFLFAEIPTAVQWIGFVLAVGAIVLINYEKGATASTARLPLLLMLLAGGGGDAMSKVFEVYGPAEYGDLFLFYTFVSAFVLCLALILWKRERPDKYALLFGVLVGVPNFFSAKFLLMALGHLPAVIVYPTFSVATILAVTLAGICLFGERLRKLQWAALTGILAALIMLNI
ncbi:MAG: DMT family transporter [Clostridia bacterium]|nr:DMT family transporter [Clostridia bacterium]